ncbi:3-deoxy-7-phosphoheptulonate synthase [bacterium]|nr:3-deoxy-7-phosphoheptulonate synthase [bacterium]
MIIVLKKDEQAETIRNITDVLANNGFTHSVLPGAKYILIPVLGDFTTEDLGRFRSFKGVHKILKISAPYYLVTKEFREKTVVDLGDGVRIGDGFCTIAGPCSVESEESIREIASLLSKSGVRMLRGGTFKLRSSPYSFQGMGVEGLRLLNSAAREHNMKCISEISDIRNIDSFMEYVDVIQVGARNMQNYALLKELSTTKKPILLKRSPSATAEEFLLSAEYLLSGGNENVILCERGIKSFDSAFRNDINIASVPHYKHISHLPVILDPSHGIGVPTYIPAVAESAVVLGADGVMVEVHTDPSSALSDGFQALIPEKFLAMQKRISQLVDFVHNQMDS